MRGSIICQQINAGIHAKALVTNPASEKKVLTICKVAQEIQKVRVSVCGSGFYLSSKT